MNAPLCALAPQRREKTHMTCLLSRLRVMATQPVGTFLVPDVSGEGAAAMVEAARASAAAMTSFELVARTTAEIVGVWTVTWLITSIVRSLCNRAGRVSIKAHVSAVSYMSPGWPLERLSGVGTCYTCLNTTTSGSYKHHSQLQC